MVSSVKLSDRDIATLLEGVRSGMLAAETGIGSDKDCRAFRFDLIDSNRSLAVPLPFATYDQTKADQPFQRLRSIAALLRGKMQQNNDNRDDNWSNRLRDAVFSITREIAPRIVAPVLQNTNLPQLKRTARIGTGALENPSIVIDNTTNITARMDHPNGN